MELEQTPYNVWLSSFANINPLPKKPVWMGRATEIYRRSKNKIRNQDKDRHVSIMSIERAKAELTQLPSAAGAANSGTNPLLVIAVLLAIGYVVVKGE